MNKRIRKKKQAQKPDLQTAWNVVADYLKKDGHHSYFIGSPVVDELEEYNIHKVSPYRKVIESTINKK